MKRLAYPSSLLALILLAACAGESLEQVQLADTSCPPLKDRYSSQNLAVTTAPGSVLSHQSDLSNAYYGQANWYNQASLDPITVSFASSGNGYVGWRDKGGWVHVTPIDATLARRGDDVVFQADRLRDLRAEDEGFTVFGLEGTSMVLRRYQDEKTLTWKTPFYIDHGSTSLHMARFAHTPGKGFAVYFGIEGQWDGNTYHQGDALQWVSESGKWTPWPSSWTWGCSHSHDLRIESAENGVYPVCLGDNFPAAIAFFKNTVLASEVQDYHGGGAGILGGMARFGNYLIIAEATAYNRGLRDVALIGLSVEDKPTSRGTDRLWLTATNNVQEAKPNIARLGDKLLVTYSRESNKLEPFHAEVFDLEVITAAGKLSTLKRTVLEQADLAMDIGPVEDLATAPNGDVVFAAAGADGKSLKMQRIAACH